MIFHDRVTAGQLLAKLLSAYKNCAHGIVLGLPRGGVPVAKAISDALLLPLDVLIVRKIGLPYQPELAVGALSSDTEVFNENLLQTLHCTKQSLLPTILAEKTELKRREAVYRAGKPVLQLQNAVVIVVDDGVATGASMRAALITLRAQKIARICVASPVIATQTMVELRALADEIYCLRSLEPDSAIGSCYQEFGQTTDSEVLECLEPV